MSATAVPALVHARRSRTAGGRLVYFYPCLPASYHDGELPTHPALRLVANSEQLLCGGQTARRLITMQKVTAYDAGGRAAGVWVGGGPLT